MGRRTFDSLGKCLPERLNIVVTHRFALFPETDSCRCSGGIIEAMALAERLASRPRRDVFIIGGASMYEQFAPYVDRYLITEVRKAVPSADTFFRDSIIGDHRDWRWRTLYEGTADPSAGDEADFRIFEAVAGDPSRFVQPRNEAIADFSSIGGLRAGARSRQRLQVAATA
jgi:dihydrofolate reductase